VFSPDSRNVISFAEQEYDDDEIAGCPVRVYDISTGELRCELPSESKVFDVEFSPEGNRLATAHLDRHVRIWDFPSGKPAADNSSPLPHSDWVFTARFSADGRFLLTACRDRSVRLWDWRAGNLEIPPMEHTDEVFDALFSPDGQWIVTACADSTVSIWARSTGQLIAPPRRLGGGQVWSLAMTPDGRRLAFAGLGNAFEIWPLESLTVIPPLPVEALCKWHELVAGKALYESSGLTNIAPAIWLARWRDFRGRFPANRR
jgi:WD40 repeat protein